jgi:hypothetical protein
MNVVDSSCWIDYFGDVVAGDFAETAINDIANLYVPSITIYERRGLDKRFLYTILSSYVFRKKGGY